MKKIERMLALVIGALSLIVAPNLIADETAREAASAPKTTEQTATADAKNHPAKEGEKHDATQNQKPAEKPATTEAKK